MNRMMIAAGIVGVLCGHSHVQAQTTQTAGPLPPVTATAHAVSTPPKPAAMTMEQFATDSMRAAKPGSVVTTSPAAASAAASRTAPTKKLPPVKAHVIAPDTAVAKKPGGGH